MYENIKNKNSECIGCILSYIKKQNVYSHSQKVVPSSELNEVF